MTPVPSGFCLSAPGSGVVRRIEPNHWSFPAFLFRSVYASGLCVGSLLIVRGICESNYFFGPYLPVRLGSALIGVFAIQKTSFGPYLLVGFGFSGFFRTCTWDRTSRVLCVLLRVRVFAFQNLYMGVYLRVCGWWLSGRDLCLSEVEHGSVPRFLRFRLRVS